MRSVMRRSGVQASAPERARKFAVTARGTRSRNMVALHGLMVGELGEVHRRRFAGLEVLWPERARRRDFVPRQRLLTRRRDTCYTEEAGLRGQARSEAGALERGELRYDGKASVDPSPRIAHASLPHGPVAAKRKKSPRRAASPAWQMASDSCAHVRPSGRRAVMALASCATSPGQYRRHLELQPLARAIALNAPGSVRRHGAR